MPANVPNFASSLRLLSPKHTTELLERIDVVDCEESLAAFVRYTWPAIEPGVRLMWAWPAEAICDHLEAVAAGEITRLLISVPPGTMKSTLAQTMFPAWLWGPLNRANERFVLTSYSSYLTEAANVRTARLIASPLYQKRWGSRFRLIRAGDERVQNDKTGWTTATSVEGVSTGARGSVLVVDDPNSVVKSESSAVIERTNRWFSAAMTDRLNDLTKSAIIVIQQRTAENDVTGMILSKQLGYVHLCIPALYDASRHCATVIGWSDPRGNERGEDGELDPYAPQLPPEEQPEHDGENFWPERFPPEALEEQRLSKGPWDWASQYQQSPTPKGGGIIKEEWWQYWSRGQHPTYNLVVACLDTNQSQKEENDYSALAIMGLFDLEGKANAMLSMVWRSRLELNVPPISAEDRRILGLDRTDLSAHERKAVIEKQGMPGEQRKQPGEKLRGFTPMERARILEKLHCLGLVDKVAAYCEGYHVDKLLIENKANGHAIESEIRRQYPNRSFAIEFVDPEGTDKAARAHAVVAPFAAGLIWAPGENGMLRDWAQTTVNECAQIPRGAHDDCADACIYVVRWFRRNNLLLMPAERLAQEERQRDYDRRRPAKALYPG